jgi:hypothetical protein
LYFFFDEAMYAQDRVDDFCFLFIRWRGGFVSENLIIKPKVTVSVVCQYAVDTDTHQRGITRAFALFALFWLISLVGLAKPCTADCDVRRREDLFDMSESNLFCITKLFRIGQEGEPLTTSTPYHLVNQPQNTESGNKREGK